MTTNLGEKNGAPLWVWCNVTYKWVSCNHWNAQAKQANQKHQFVGTTLSIMQCNIQWVSCNHKNFEAKQANHKHHFALQAHPIHSLKCPSKSSKSQYHSIAVTSNNKLIQAHKLIQLQSQAIPCSSKLTSKQIKQINHWSSSYCNHQQIKLIQSVSSQQLSSQFLLNNHKWAIKLQLYCSKEKRIINYIIITHTKPGATGHCRVLGSRGAGEVSGSSGLLDFVHRIDRSRLSCRLVRSLDQAVTFAREDERPYRFRSPVSLAGVLLVFRGLGLRSSLWLRLLEHRVCWSIESVKSQFWSTVSVDPRRCVSFKWQCRGPCTACAQPVFWTKKHWRPTMKVQCLSL